MLRYACNERCRVNFSNTRARAVAPSRSRSSRSLQHPYAGLGDGGDVARRDHEAGVADRLGDPADVGAHRRPAARHRLHHRVREALGDAGERDQAAGVVRLDGVADPALQHGVPGQPQLVDQRLAALVVDLVGRRRAAEDAQPGVRDLLADQRERPDQGVQVLERVDPAHERDGRHVRLARPRAGTRPGRRRCTSSTSARGRRRCAAASAGCTASAAPARR